MVKQVHHLEMHQLGGAGDLFQSGFIGLLRDYSGHLLAALEHHVDGRAHLVGELGLRGAVLLVLLAHLAQLVRVGGVLDLDEHAGSALIIKPLLSDLNETALVGDFLGEHLGRVAWILIGLITSAKVGYGGATDHGLETLVW